MKNVLKRSSDVYPWRFFRAGGFDQVRLDSGKDLLELERLDQKLWVALACPVDNVHFDAKTLSFIDNDNDRRVRAIELIAAIKWAALRIKNVDDLIGGKSEVSLSQINDTTEEGRILAAAIKRSLLALKKTENDSLSLGDIESLEKVLAEKPFNGDGVITEYTADTDFLRTIIKEIITVCGSVNDRSGQPGVSLETIEAFFSQARAYDAWFAESEINLAILPLGESTEKAANAFLAIQDKVNDYFTRCAIAAFDNKALIALNGGENPYQTIGTRLLTLDSSDITDLPIATVHAEQLVSFINEVNPAWLIKLNAFLTAAQSLLSTKEKITKSEWDHISELFIPYIDWQKRKPNIHFDTIGITGVRDRIQGIAQKNLLSLVEQDNVESGTFASLQDIEKLLRYLRDIYPLCTNFVNFKDFYANGGKSMFKAGTLYLDQRSCELCIKVDDITKHSQMSAMAGTYLIYCECRRKNGAEKMNIVAALTNGDSENLMVGRNGIFYDRAGNDWDATVIKIFENPISLRQAFWLPYKSLVRMIETQVAKRASAADAQSSSKLEQTALATAHIDKNKPDVAPKKLDIGVVAALGVAAGALGTFIATLMGYASGIIRLGPFAIIGAFIGVLLLISGPSLILAYIKLRKRNIGPILDASGWAINAKARINVPFGVMLTHIATLPPGAQRDLADPYAEKKSPWPKLIVIALILYGAYVTLDHFGFVNTWTKGMIGKSYSKVGKN